MVAKAGLVSGSFLVPLRVSNPLCPVPGFQENCMNCNIPLISDFLALTPFPEIQGTLPGEVTAPGGF